MQRCLRWASLRPAGTASERNACLSRLFLLLLVGTHEWPFATFVSGFGIRTRATSSLVSFCDQKLSKSLQLCSVRWPLASVSCNPEVWSRQSQCLTSLFTFLFGFNLNRLPCLVPSIRCWIMASDKRYKTLFETRHTFFKCNSNSITWSIPTASQTLVEIESVKSWKRETATLKNLYPLIVFGYDLPSWLGQRFTELCSKIVPCSQVLCSFLVDVFVEMNLFCWALCLERMYYVCDRPGWVAEKDCCFKLAKSLWFLVFCTVRTIFKGSFNRSLMVRKALW